MNSNNVGGKSGAVSLGLISNGNSIEIAKKNNDDYLIS